MGLILIPQTVAQTHEKQRLANQNPLSISNDSAMPYAFSLGVHEHLVGRANHGSSSGDICGLMLASWSFWPFINLAVH